MKVRKSVLIFAALAGSSFLVITVLTAFNRLIPQEDLKSKYAYKDFESAKKCRSCHPGIYEQWSQAMMSQAYTHHWDEIEYFELAVPHAAHRKKAWPTSLFRAKCAILLSRHRPIRLSTSAISSNRG